MNQDSSDPIPLVPDEPRDSAKSRPARVLPTERIAFAKQLELLRAYAAASGSAGKSVLPKDVAPLVKMSAATPSLASAFFQETGLLQRGENRGFIPSGEVRAYHRAHQWNPDTAAHRLASILATSWFAAALVPRLEMRAMEEKAAITVLAEASEAGPDYESQLRVLLEYLEASGIIERDGLLIRLAAAQQARPDAPEPATRDTQPMSGEQQSSATLVRTGFQSTEGIVQFHVDVRVDMAELSGWRPDRIAAFFSGLAQVLAAKGGVEEGGSR